MADSDSDSSGLSSAPEEEVQRLAPIFAKAKKATKVKFPPPAVSPPRPKRPPSPPHEDAFADNPDIAFIVMFRSRFNDLLPAKLSHFGPQDIERGVTDEPPSPEVQNLLCALLALVLNRKKPVERGHHGRALEEAVLSQKAQWPYSWNGVNPLHGPRDFNTMSPAERLNLLRTLIHWSLISSEAVTAIIKDKYKQSRHNDDENQPLSVQPWGVDGDKRRYFLVQGQNDTNFRVYREGSRYTKNAHWYSVAGNIVELRALVKKLEEVDGTQAARRLAMKVTNAIPTFEASEIKRQRREYRQIRTAAFGRPEPGYSLYEGRTRGKRMRYTYDDDDDQGLDSDATSTRRSARRGARETPSSDGPTYTASGRQIRQPRTGHYGESLLRQSVGVDDGPSDTDAPAPEYQPGEGDDEDSEPPTTFGRATRGVGRPAANGASNPRKRKHIDGYNSIDDMSQEEDAAPSGDEWNSDDNEAGDVSMPDADDADEEPSEDENDNEDEDGEPKSLVVRLRLSPKALLKRDNVADGRAQMNGDAPDTNADHAQDPSQASAGAAKHDQQPALANGYTTAQTAAGQHLTATPPSAASAYPTPASASFPVSEVKPAVASVADEGHLKAHHQTSTASFKGFPTAQANGVGAHAYQERMNGY